MLRRYLEGRESNNLMNNLMRKQEDYRALGSDIFIHTEKFENFRIRITSKVACGIIQPTVL